MPSSCRSSAGCGRTPTRGVFGAYFCEEHFNEIDQIRRTWFTTDGGVLRSPRDPDEELVSLPNVVDQVHEFVKSRSPYSVSVDQLRDGLNLSKSLIRKAAHLAAGDGRIVSTRVGYVVGGRRPAAERALEVARVVHAAGAEMTLAQICAATGMTPNGSGQRVVRFAIEQGWLRDQRRGRVGGLAPGPVKPDEPRSYAA